MEVSVRQELNSLVEQLTHSGATELNQERMKKVKAICKLVYMHRIMKGVLKLHDRMLGTQKEQYLSLVQMVQLWKGCGSSTET